MELISPPNAMHWNDLDSVSAPPVSKMMSAPLPSVSSSTASCQLGVLV